MSRIIWKGAINFGLVHVPVALHSATTDVGIDFDWLDKRTLDPVGYRRVNKRTGKEVNRADIVKGVKVDKGGEYVVLSDEEIKAAYPRSTQTIDLQAFVHADEVPFTFLDTPYYLEPLERGEKVYALLREAMLDAGVIGIARVVMHTKEHLAALIATGPALMLDTLRWPGAIRPWSDLALPAEGKKASQLKESELKMARELIASMTEPWHAERYAEQFSDAVRALVKQRQDAGQTAEVQPMEGAAPPASNVLDLTELLARSLGKGHPARKAPARKAASRKRA